MVWAVEVVDVTGSTNADLVRAARDGDRGPRVLVSRAQTQGRGRLGRTWQSAPGASLAASVLWAPAAPQAAWTWLPAAVGLAVLDAAAALGAAVGTGPGQVALKWPNDVVVVGPRTDDGAAGAGGAGTVVGARTGLAKLAGILSEVAAGPRGPVVVLGVGINLADPDPRLAGDAATSLARVLGRAVPLEEVVPVLVDALRARLLGWEAAGGDADAAGLVAGYRAVCTTLGRQVRAATPGGTREGVAVDLDPDGSLVLDQARPGAGGAAAGVPGRRVRVAAGDVEHVR